MKLTPPAKSVILSICNVAAMLKNTTCMETMTIALIAKWSTSNTLTGMFLYSMLENQLFWQYYGNCLSSFRFWFCGKCGFNDIHYFVPVWGDWGSAAPFHFILSEKIDRNDARFLEIVLLRWCSEGLIDDDWCCFGFCFAGGCFMVGVETKFNAVSRCPVYCVSTGRIKE